MERKLRRVELIHTGILVGGWLIAELTGWLLRIATGEAGGIGGLGTQTLVSTVAAVLRILVLVILPFLTVARSGAALMAARGEEPRILPGLQAWQEVVFTGLPVGLRCILTGLVASYLAERVFLLTPMAGPVYLAVMEGGDLQTALAEQMDMMLLIFLPVFGLLLLPTVYRWRCLSFVIADRGLGGFRATMMAGELTRAHKAEALGEDLKRWWYYLPMAVGVGLMGAPWLMELLEISLPVPGMALTLPGAALVLGLELTAGPKVRQAQAKRYETYAAGPAQPKKRPAPRQEDLPWAGWDQN